MPAINDWDTSPSKVVLFCVSCWWKQHKQRHDVIRTGDDGKCIWRCADKRSIAKVAMARRLGVRLYWMWRKGWEYSDWVKFGSHAGQLGTGDGVQ